MSKEFVVVLARRFAPLNFSKVLGFPNLVPHIEEWQHRLLRFRGDKDDHPVEHLIEFHDLMHLLGVSCGNVLMKMFVYSLDGDVHEWFRSLLDGTISSLKEFRETFQYYCKGLYSSEFLIENYCEEFKFYIQHNKVDSSSSVEEEFYEEFVKDVNSY